MLKGLGSGVNVFCDFGRLWRRVLRLRCGDALPLKEEHVSAVAIQPVSLPSGDLLDQPELLELPHDRGGRAVDTVEVLPSGVDREDRLPEDEIKRLYCTAVS